MNATPLCIYHHACTDGFAAAWAVRRFHAGLVEFHPGIYGKAPPDVTGRNVIIVDFSYKRDVMLQLIEQANDVLIIDHHDTSQADLQDLPAKARAIFDNTQCGAALTWQHLFPGEMQPLLFDHIQDRDLWQFKLPMTREIMAAVFSYPMTFEHWDQLMTMPPVELEREGRSLIRKHNADVAAIADNATRWINIAGTHIPAANAPWMFASDVGARLAEGNPFAATYYDDEDGRRFSLRSAQDGANVETIAKRFGGGGHKHAAGFRITRQQAIEFEIMGALSPDLGDMESYGQAEKKSEIETSAPAIVFYPAGSLGEEVAP